MTDIVNHPSHYEQNSIRLEPIHITSRLPHPVASAFEYCIRAGKKDGVPEHVDLQKALFWLMHFYNYQSANDNFLGLDPADVLILNEFHEGLDFEFAGIIATGYRNDQSWQTITEQLIKYVQRRLCDLHDKETTNETARN